LETAHFISLILANRKLTQVINTASDRMVLLLGRFTPARKHVLERMRALLLEHRYAPVIFDFAVPRDRDSIETVTGLASLARWVLADRAAPKSSPLEIYAIVPDLMVPFASVIKEGHEPFSMLADLRRKYDWVLPTLTYRDEKDLARYFSEAILRPAETLRKR